MQIEFQIKPSSQKNINNQQGEPQISQEPSHKSNYGLFRFATRKDKIFILIGTISALALGAAIPLFSLLWGNLINTFRDQDIVEGARTVMIQFIWLGLGALGVGWSMFSLWMIAGSRQSTECRRQYMKSLINEDIEWFDLQNQAQISSQFASDCQSYQSAVGQKIANLIMIVGSFIAGLVVAFVKGWLMALVVLASIPVVILGWFFLVRVTMGKKKIEDQAYYEAGGKLEEAISGIKTVKMLNGQSHQSSKYSEILLKAKNQLQDFSHVSGMSVAASRGFLFLSYTLSFWFGSKCIEGSSNCSNDNSSNPFTIGNVLTIFFSLLLPALNMSQVIPSLEKISEGKAAAARIFAVIDRIKKVVSKPNAIKPNQFLGIFRFEGVSFAYPKDKSKKILDNFTCQILHASCAFVGKSGCGKSTIFQLMMRFYDPDQGRVTLDGNDLRDIDLSWLRSHFGYVGQEPVLFAASIRENMKMSKPDATDEEIYRALEQAEAYDFIQSFSGKLDTFVGSGGSQISGGQKQRIAIARALLKNPKILLMDEATSSLDRKNEILIQQTIIKIARNRTIITIAHTITTIAQCQKIFVVNNGRISEEGRFKDLKYFQSIKNNFQQQIYEGKDCDQIVDLSQRRSLSKKQQNKENMVGKTSKIGIVNEQASSAIILQAVQSDDIKPAGNEAYFCRLFSYAKEVKIQLAVGLVATLINGANYPIFSVFLGKILALQLTYELNPDHSRKEIDKFTLIQFLISLLFFVVAYIQHSFLSKVGISIAQKIRNETFSKLLKMPIPWFEKECNLSGKLSARIQEDFRNIQSFCSNFLISMTFLLSNIIISVILAFFFEWRIALISFALLPFIGLGGFIQYAYVSGMNAESNKGVDQSSQIVSQIVHNIRTVLANGSEVILERYSNFLQSSYDTIFKKSFSSGFFFGLSYMIMFITVALIFYLATVVTEKYKIDVNDVFPAIFLVMFAGITIGNTINYVPDITSSKTSALNVFSIIDSEDEDQLQIKDGSLLLKTPIKGEIQFENVSFQYQSRTQLTLNELSFKVQLGQKVNLVGQSGCGKSTTVQLLLGFYQPIKGRILVDGVDLKKYDVHHLRSSLGVVSQEPTLFNQSIADNIRYNIEANIEEITEAANQSNFNPDNQAKQSTQKQDGEAKKGFEKNVGIKGSHISGGQKQRVAIARTILRKPAILLLDEATSALDSKNEQAVQQTLERLMEGKTTINVTHRLYTIKENDGVLLFENGKIVESGKFDDLLKREGKFNTMYKRTISK